MKIFTKVRFILKENAQKSVTSNENWGQTSPPNFIQPNQDIAAIVQALKGESSHWVNNKTALLKHRLEWCADY